MKVQYASDLHLEFYDNAVFIAGTPFQAVGDVLLLAGDTLPLKEFDTYKGHRFFDWCADNYEKTLLVPGNHEYYHDNLAGYPDSWRKELRSNVWMCENESVRVGDTDFILSTLWSRIPGKGREIALWMEQHTDGDCQYAILDDVAEFSGELAAHHVLVRPDVGITAADADKVIRLLEDSVLDTERYPRRRYLNEAHKKHSEVLQKKHADSSLPGEKKERGK